MEPEIPKIIHYCWFGQHTLPKEFLKNIESWQKFNPGFNLMFWGNNDLPMEYSYVKNAYLNKKWANLSNFTRLYALKHYGGIYLDTDVISLKSFSPFLNNSCFLGIESKTNEKIILNNAIIGAVKAHFFINKCFNTLIEKFDGCEAANLSSPILTTNVFNSLTITDQNKISIYESDFFYPSNWNSKDKINITNNSITIHEWKASWHDEFDHLANKQYLIAINKFLQNITQNKLNIKYILKFFTTFLRSLTFS